MIYNPNFCSLITVKKTSFDIVAKLIIEAALPGYIIEPAVDRKSELLSIRLCLKRKSKQAQILKVLEDNHWTYHEFDQEIGKLIVIELVKEINQ